MQLQVLHQVAAAFDDLAATRTFYQETLGARFLADFEPPGLLFFDFAGVRLLFERGNAPAVLYFRVESVDAAYQELLDKGITFEVAPHLIHKDLDGAFGDPGAEEWMAFFKDPGGNMLALVEQRPAR